QDAARAATATEHRAQAVSERAGARRTGLVAGAMPTRRSTAGTALEAEQSRNLPQAPSRRLRSAIRRPRHRLGPELTNIPQRPNAGIAPCRIHRGTRAAAALYPKASDKGPRAEKGQRKGAKIGRASCREREYGSVG